MLSMPPVHLPVSFETQQLTYHATPDHDHLVNASLQRHLWWMRCMVWKAVIRGRRRPIRREAALSQWRATRSPVKLPREEHLNSTLHGVASTRAHFRFRTSFGLSIHSSGPRMIEWGGAPRHRFGQHHGMESRHQAMAMHRLVRSKLLLPSVMVGGFGHVDGELPPACGGVF